MNKKQLQRTIAQAQAGNQTAYTELLHLYWGDVYRFLLSKCTNDYDAEDITIKAFSKAFDKLHLYKPDYVFKNWLITIANNLYIDHRRSQRNKIESVDVPKEQVVVIADIAPSPEDKLIKEQHLSALLRDIKKLKPHYREVIQLRYFQEYSYKEMAEELGESLSSVKVKLLRARKLLSEIIKAGRREKPY